MCAKRINRRRRSRSRFARWLGNAAKSPWTIMISVVASAIAILTTFTGPVQVIGAPTSTKPGTLSVKALPDGPAMLVDDEDDSERLFAFNLEPGEAGSIDLRLHAETAGYSGRVVADVTGGGARHRSSWHSARAAAASSSPDRASPPGSSCR